jgi:TRAP-type C4-dicarboxylate transport system permease small subunit
MLEKFEKLNKKLSNWIEWVGFGALFLMVVLTCVDVIGSKLFLTPVFGALDVMMLAQLIAISCGGAMALIVGRHVSVEFFMPLFPKRIQAITDCIVYLMCLVLFAFVVWRLFVHGYHYQSGGEESMTARIPLSPFVYTSAVALISMCLVFIQRFLSSVVKVVKNES